MGLFSKKCSICGEKAGMISGKKLVDGNICGDCINKLSPWFDAFSDSTVDDIKAQMAWRDSQKDQLAAFNMTKAWGIKKYPDAMQFIFDREKKLFTVVPGPEESFKDRKPDIFSFSDALNVTLEVDEYWSEKGGEFDPRGIGQLTQDRYKDVFWRYDFYLVIKMNHPFIEEIRYKMNYKTTIMKVPQRGIVFRRGLGIGGTYTGEDLKGLANALESIGAKEESAIETGKELDVIMLRDKDKSLVEKIVQGLEDDKYLKKIENISAHVKRAARISKLLL